MRKTVGRGKVHGLRWPHVLGVAVVTCLAMLWAAGRPERMPTKPVVTGKLRHWMRPSDLPDLPDGGILSGRVLADDHRAVVGARVCAVCAVCDISASPPGHCAASQASGAFSLSSLPKGEFIVTASHPDYQVSQARGGVPISVSDRHLVDDILIMLTPAKPTLSGIVLDATGGPIVDATVQIATTTGGIHPPAEVTSDAQGRFSVALPNGPVAIRAEAQGYAPALIYRVVPSADAMLSLVPGSAIEGIVVHAGTGERLAGVSVNVRGTRSATLVLPVVSNEDGRFYIAGLEPGQYALVAEGDHYRGHLESVLDVGLGSQTKNIVVRAFPAVTVTGNVLVGAGSEPCTGGQVIIGSKSPFALVGRAVPADAAIEPVSEMKLPTVQSAIRRSGEVRLRGVLPGHYQVVLDCHQHVYETGPVVLDVRDEDLSVTWRVKSGLGLRVRVRDESGQPVPRANLMVEVPSSNSATNVFVGLDVDERGLADVVGVLYPGRYVIHPDESFGVDPIAVELKDGDGTKTVDVALRGLGSVRVNVHSARGVPINDVYVAAQSEQGTSEAARGASHRAVPMGGGEFVIRPLQPGEYTVRVWDGVNPAVHARGATGELISLHAGEEVVVNAVSDCDAQLTGVVVDDRGESVANAWVSATHVGRGDDEGGLLTLSSELARVLSDEEGRFALGGLCASSSYDVRAEQHQGAASVTSALKPHDGARLVLPRGGEVDGTVVGADGQPHREFNLTIEHFATQQTRQLQLRTRDGTFHLENLPAGENKVSVTTAETSAAANVLVPPGERIRGLRLILEPARANTASVDDG